MEGSSLHLHPMTTFDWLTATFSVDQMDGSGCQQNCSGHGHCQDGLCICQVQFSGCSCESINFGYFFAFGAIFICLSIITFIQLCLCIKNEYHRQRGKKSFQSAMKLTAPKILYVFTILATALRSVYFFTKWRISEVVSLNLWSAYYPVVLSGFAFIVCLWAEAFHLKTVNHDKPGFLSKSVMGFYLFNIFIYTMLCAQLVATDVSTDLQFSDIIIRISNSCFALLMIIAVIFFLIYGVEVYFKVKGAFISFIEPNKNVDPWQLHSSRIGLLAQALLQLITALFIVSDVLKDFWRDQLPILNQNFYDIGFRLSEFGIALWFPCVLWNFRRLFTGKSFEFHDDTDSDNESETGSEYTQYGAIKTTTDSPKLDCWICYDVERQDAGALIQPCQCKGDVATVHHECLRKWLMECAEKEEALKCKVCNKPYKLEDSWVWLPRGLKKRHWFQTCMLSATMVGAPFGTYAMTHSIYGSETYVQILIIGLTILVELICLRFLGVTFGICLRNGRLSNVTILGKKVLDSLSHDRSCDKIKQEVVSNQNSTNTTRQVPLSSCESGEHNTQIAYNSVQQPPVGYSQSSLKVGGISKDKNSTCDSDLHKFKYLHMDGASRHEETVKEDDGCAVFCVSDARSYSISVEAVIETHDKS